MRTDRQSGCRSGVCIHLGSLGWGRLPTATKRYRAADVKMWTMRRGASLALMSTIAVLLTGVAAISQIYALSETSRGTVLWSDREAYLILDITREGDHVSYLRYPWVLFKNHLGGFMAVEPVEDQRWYLTSIRVASSGLERHALKVPERPPGIGPDLLTPLQGRVYANCPFLAGSPSPVPHGLCWLNGGHFERATSAEELRLDGINSLTAADIDHGKRGVWRDDYFVGDPYRKPEGGERLWSKRTFRTGSDSRNLTIGVGREFTIAITVSGSNSPAGGAISIDLLRPGRVAERIWAFKARHAIVSRTEYAQAFH